MSPITHRRWISVALALLPLMAMVQACATGSGEVFLQPIERGEEQGPDTAKKGLPSDPALATYLQRVGSRIAAANPDRPIPP